MLKELIEKYPPRKDNLLLLLHEAQKLHADKNYIPQKEIAEIAKYLSLPLSEVDGVVSFYKLFSNEPRGRYVIRLCDSLSCRISGSLDLYHYCKSMLGIGRGETTADGMFTLETVNCIGSCDTAPNMMIGDKLYTSLTPLAVEEIIKGLYREAKEWK